MWSLRIHVAALSFNACQCTKRRHVARVQVRAALNYCLCLRCCYRAACKCFHATNVNTHDVYFPQHQRITDLWTLVVLLQYFSFLKLVYNCIDCNDITNLLICACLDETLFRKDTNTVACWFFIAWFFRNCPLCGLIHAAVTPTYSTNI